MQLRGAARPRDSVILMVTVMTPGMDALQRQHSCLWLLLDSGSVSHLPSAPINTSLWLPSLVLTF